MGNCVQAAHELFNQLAAKLGVASHSGKRVVVAGTADPEMLARMDFDGAEIVHGVIFAGLPIACAATEGGRAFIDEFCNEKVAHISLLCKRLQSLDRLQDAYTILSRSISHKLVHLHAAWPACAQGRQGIQWFERVDEVVLAAVADLIGVPGLPPTARVIAEMASRLTGAGLPLGHDRAAAAAIAFSVDYMIGLPGDQLLETEDSPYMDEIAQLRDGLIKLAPAVAEILASPVRSRLLARLSHVVNDKKAVNFLETLPGDIAIRRTAMPAGGTHLDAIGTSKAELLSNKVWTGLTRKHFGIPLLTSSYNTMESGLGCTEKCLVCGDRLDSGGNHALFCDGGTWGQVHTHLKHNVKDFFTAVAAGSGGRVANIVLEASHQLSSNNRPGDVAGNDNGKAFAVDVFVTRVGSATNRGKSVDKVIDEADAVKRVRYEQECKDSGVLFFTFGMDAEGRLGSQAEDTIRHFTNRLRGDQVTRDIFRRYWTRRIVVGFLARQMQLVLNRQERRSPRFSRIADLVARRDCGVSDMPGGRLGGSNRGTRRIVSAAGLMRQTSVNAVS